MKGTLEWNEKGIKWLFDLLLRMVYMYEGLDYKMDRTMKQS